MAAPGRANTSDGGILQAESALLHRIGTEIFELWQNLEASEKPDWLQPQRFLISEGERFRLWAHSLGLHRQGHASLDYRVRDVVVVKERLADILTNLKDNLNCLLAILRGERLPMEDEWDAEESSSDAAPPSTNSTSDSDQSFHEVDFRKQSITEALDALYSLGTKIRNPRNRPQRPTRELFKHVPSETRDIYIQEREAIEIAIVCQVQRQVLDQLLSAEGQDHGPPDLPFETLRYVFATDANPIVRRAGVANARRKQQFIYWKEHAARITSQGATIESPLSKSNGQTVPVEQLGPVPQPTPAMTLQVPTPSLHDRSLATSATRLSATFVGLDDLRSILSHQTRVSTVVTPQGQKLEWPPPPSLLTPTSKFFTCPYCHVICPKEYLAKDAWRSHLIHDLKPYHCTFNECSDPNRLYGSLQEWLNHESLHARVWYCPTHESEFWTQAEYVEHLRHGHPDADAEQFSAELVAAAARPTSKPRQLCPFCPSTFSDVKHMQKHVRYHLEHLALFSMPPTPDDEGDDEEGRRDASLDSHRAIQRGGREDSLDRDFGANSASTASSGEAGPRPSGAIALGVIQDHSPQGLNNPDTSITNWLMQSHEFEPPADTMISSDLPAQSPVYYPLGVVPPYDPPADGLPLPDGWTPLWDHEFQCWYYGHEATGRTQWTHPAYGDD